MLGSAIVQLNCPTQTQIDVAMNAQSYLMFKLGPSHYGIPAKAVQEIFFLPEVVAITEVPAAILGVINLRGELLTVVDLNLRLGQPRPPLQLTDSMIVLEWQAQRVGIIVSQVDSVQLISDDQIATTLHDPREEHSQHGVVTGIANIEEGIVTLLNPELLVRYTVDQSVLQPSFQKDSMQGVFKEIVDSNLSQGLYDHFDAQAKQIFRERTAALQCPIEDQDSTGLMPLAVVGLGDEYFGFELETVYEFTNIQKITPIPCCPSHIIGNINLRGEIVTLVNISEAIDLPVNSVRSHPQAVVIRLDQRVVGLAVDDIFDVTYIHPSQMTVTPIAMHSAKDDYLQGVAPYQDRMMSIINLSKLLTSDVLVVNEEV